jgi:hypothetical protein
MWITSPFASALVAPTAQRSAAAAKNMADAIRNERAAFA